ncbi:hypothetical protein SERLADRAFT_469109 [Serpula lacrymans var. lacrymans S7.9]|uniref:Uncharacterized protein n=1 Tax=Serpula lacrymans var. lacrymans (strain S7.9) TaxID=578457 RepID=F8NWL6_SERL9|nr:uncharacterized protein SERLADRAFT_469109 [Serpula lacrymans var. lacrymans S7.9]EGO25040.1 hypothetical protein SERLADRAFT_469109 [Serpula lacrymans var. lacrymans S7.9]
MMLYHDGLRILTAEEARHSSKTRATPSDIFLLWMFFFVVLILHLQDWYSIVVHMVSFKLSSISFAVPCLSIL